MSDPTNTQRALPTWRDREVDAKRRFDNDTRNHVLEVVHDQGVYRHLRCKQPDTWSYGFSVVTWPGHLALTGDMGDVMFARLPDMFQFFRTDSERGRINASYWAEKIRGPKRGRQAVLEYSPDEFRRTVLDWVEQWDEELSPAEMEELRTALHADVLSDDDIEHDEAEARRLFERFEWNGRRPRDVWDYSFTEYDSCFLWQCWAIGWAIREYDRVTVPAGAPIGDSSPEGCVGHGQEVDHGEA